MDKQPFDIDVALERIEEAVRPWPKAALFQLAEEGFTSTFEQLLACIISIRTYDEVTLPVSRKLFTRARTASTVKELSWEELDALISQSTFHERKANQILTIASQVTERFGDTLPGDRGVLLSFAGAIQFTAYSCAADAFGHPSRDGACTALIENQIRPKLVTVAVNVAPQLVR